MSFFTEGARSDLAVSRTMLINHSDKDSNGNKRFQVLPWEVVSYADGVGGFEPVSILDTDGVLSGGLQVGDSDRHPTDILFVSQDSFVHYDGGTPVNGGDIGFPRR